MKPRICSQCAFGVWEPTVGVPLMSLGWSTLLMCANSAEAPGRLRAVAPNATCRNFVVRHDPSYRLPPPEPPAGDFRFIPLTRGHFAIVDAADYEWLSQYNWLAMTSDNTVYAFRKANGKVILMHREIMKPRKGQVVDHINHNGADNRRANMRNCLPRHNMYNARARRGTSRCRGVARHHGTKWTADIGYLCVRIHIGLFADEIEAAHARDRMAIMLHGEYAYLNFPDDWPAEARDALHNSPEAVQARAHAKRRSRRLAKARRNPARTSRKARMSKGKRVRRTGRKT
jgi:hypothetical protein